MDLLVLRLLLALVEQGVILSFRVTKDKIYLISDHKKITAHDVVVSETVI